MAGNLQPLDQKFPIAKPDGTPTDYFIRWAQQRQIDITDGITAEQAVELIQQWAAERQIVAGAELDGGGTLDADVTIDHAESGAVPGTYGDSTHVAKITVNEFGHIIDIEEVAISGGGGGGAVGAHRYWGIFGLGSQTGNVQLQAIHWTLSGGSPVYPDHYYASSYFSSPTYIPDNLLDDTGDYWAALGQFGVWLFGDFGTDESFDQISMLPVAAAVDQAPLQGIICVSDDATTWIQVAMFNNSNVTWASASLTQWTGGVYYDVPIPLNWNNA